MRFLTLFFLLSCAAAPAAVQSPPAVAYYSRGQLQQGVASAATASPRMAVDRLGNRGGYSYVLLRRDESGEVEVHDAWDDVIVVQEGAATLVHSGTASGGRVTAPGELRGGEITGGTAQPLAAGDLVIVPAGVPHQIQIAPGQSITYLVVKAQASPAQP